MDYERIKEQIIWDRIKQMYNDMDDAAKSQVERVFPELKESEDERIRKELLAWLKGRDGQTLPIDKFNAAIDWLEKVGKIVDYYEDRLDECACKYFNKGYKHALEKQGEQKPVPKFKIGDTMRTLQEAKDGFTDGMPVVVSIDEEYYHCTNELIAIKDQDDYEFPPMNRRQKPVEWNEKIKGLDELETYVLSLVPDRSLDAVKVDSKNIRFLINKEQKSSWSEEDEEMINYVASILYSNFNENEKFDNNKPCVGALVDWLKSLKERYTWKPSEEQLQALRWVCNRTFIAQEPQKESALEDLYEQLKAQKGE